MSMAHSTQHPTTCGLVAEVDAPPIADVHGWLDGIDVSAVGGLLDVAQAVPVDPPHASLLAHVAQVLTGQGLHRYTPIRGLPELTKSLAEHMSRAYGGEIDQRDVLITSGCNQAFCSTMRALVGQGDEVLLPVPYYFNHQMWLDMLGARAVHVPFMGDSGVPTLEAFSSRVSAATKAIVAVTPNNPTGAVYPQALLEGLYDLAHAHNIPLVLDETYKDFHPNGQQPHPLFERSQWRDTLVQLFSFSKSYSLAGFRVGSVIAGDWLLDEITKVQDCVSICAAQVSQVAAEFALTHLADEVESGANRMAGRVSKLTSAINTGDTGFDIVSAGAWFAYLKHPVAGVDGYLVARRMARELGVLSVPGSMFGPGQERYLRFAFANLRDEQIDPLIKRMAAVRTWSAADF